MPRTSTSSSALQKLTSALEAIESVLNRDEFLPCNFRALSAHFKVTMSLGTVLKNMKAIIPNPEKRGEFKLGQKFDSLRSSTVQKHINDYQRVAKGTSRKATPKVVRSVPSQAPSLETYLVALKEEMRKEVLKEMLDALSKK